MQRNQTHVSGCMWSILQELKSLCLARILRRVSYWLTNNFWYRAWMCSPIKLSRTQISGFTGTYHSLPALPEWSKPCCSGTTICNADAVYMYWLWLFYRIWKGNIHGYIVRIFRFYLFNYSSCSTTAHTPGTLSAFSRLVGCAYFRKHKAVFLPSFPTPATLFNSLLKDGQDAKSHHSAWLALIERK